MTARSTRRSICCAAPSPMRRSRQTQRQRSEIRRGRRATPTWQTQRTKAERAPALCGLLFEHGDDAKTGGSRPVAHNCQPLHCNHRYAKSPILPRDGPRLAWYLCFHKAKITVDRRTTDVQPLAITGAPRDERSALNVQRNSASVPNSVSAMQQETVPRTSALFELRCSF